MESYIYPLVIFIVMGIVFGILLTVLSKVFAVKTDPRTQQISEALPNANCGGCGYAGCADYADAIVTKGAPMNLCSPGGASTASAIGKIMGAEVSAAERKVPVIHCNGSCGNTETLFEFGGIQTCASAKRFYGGTGACMHGCVGLGDCAAVCPEGCISVKDGLAAVCTEKCIGCGKCVSACPNNLIELRSEKKKVDVLCSSKDMGPVAVKSCKVSCIACGKCVKACKFFAISIVDAHAVIDYDKCVSCGLCAKECPRGSILKKQFIKKQ